MSAILVAEDYIVQQRVLRQILSNAGHDVTIAADGLEALEYLAQNVYDLVILDIAMPEMDGIEVLKRIRADTLTCNLPVIMLTASDDDAHRLAARTAGANVFMNKPASSYEVIATVEGLIGTSA